MKQIDINLYNQTDIQIHKAVQMLAFLGKHLGLPQADDSHTTIHLEAEKSTLIGKTVFIHEKPFRAILNLNTYYLNIWSEDGDNSFDANHKTIPDLLTEVKSQLSIEKLPDFAMHYDLPLDYQLNSYLLETPDSTAVADWVAVRKLAQSAMTKVNEIITPASAIHIWPHHFDTGTYHILSKDDDGNERSIIGCGFALKDTIVPEPYFYIYGWQKNQNINFDESPTLSLGAWKTGDWNGAVLPLSALFDKNDPLSDLNQFYREGFNFYKTIPNFL